MYTQEETQQILIALQYLAGVCDFANKKDGTGFNALDAMFGHDLAIKASLTDNQATSAGKLLQKYRKQIENAGLTLPKENGIVPVKPQDKAWIEGDWIMIAFGSIPSLETRTAIKAIQGYHWHAERPDKAWSVPASDKNKAFVSQKLQIEVSGDVQAQPAQPVPVIAPVKSQPAVVITLKGNAALVTFPAFDKSNVDKVKSLPERKWFPDQPGKPWSVPESLLPELAKLFPDAVTDEIKAKIAGFVERKELSSKASGATITIPVNGTLYPFQEIGVQFLDSAAGRAIVADEMGLGKAQPLDAKILTPNGWKRMGDIKIDDDIIGKNGKPGKVIGVYPQGEKEIYKVTFSDGSSTECCKDHLWEVNSPLRKWRDRPFRIMSLSQIMDYGIKHKNGNRQHFIPLVDPVEFPARKQPLHPYLVGVLLGDGGLTCNTPMVSSEDKELINKISTMMPEGVSVIHSDKCNYRMSYKRGHINPLTATLKDLGIMGKYSYEKRIPAIYKFAGKWQRLEILRGLMDTDGYVLSDKSNGSVIQFCSTSLNLARDVVFIVRSLGGVSTINSKDMFPNKTAYILTIALPNDTNPFSLARKAILVKNRQKYSPSRSIESIEFVGIKEAQCIAVDTEDHLYVTDDFIVTHNTIQAIGYMALHPEKRPIVIVCPATLKSNWEREIKKWLPGIRQTDIHIAKGQTPYPLLSVQIVIINYDILSYWQDEIVRFAPSILICDEAHMCFLSGTHVITKNGYKNIESLSIGEKVASFGFCSNVVEYKRISAIHKTIAPENMLKVKHSFGEFICTPNHKIYVEGKGYVEAIQLQRNDNLRMVQNHLDCCKEKQAGKILQYELCGEIQNVISGKEGSIAGSNKKSTATKNRNKRPRTKQENEIKQSNEKSGNERKNAPIVEGEQIQGTWWQWENLKVSRNAICGNNITWGNNGISSKNCFSKRYIPEYFSSVQDRYCNSKCKSCNRSRREISQISRENFTGQKKRCCTEISWVENIENIKYSDCGKFTGVRPDNIVYNIEVEDNHNYFIDNGILVSNCKERKAKRTKAVQAIAKKTGSVILLTGTPVKNRPVELYTLLNIIAPNAWGNWFKYAQRYCGLTQTRWGMDVSGATNLEELHERIAPYVIRRTKSQVLTELPAKIRATLTVDFGNGARAEYDRVKEMTKERIQEAQRTGQAGAELAAIEMLKQAAVKCKLPGAIEWIENFLDSGEKLIVFITHLETAHALQEKFGDIAVTITGETPMSQRQAIVDRFQTEPKTRLFIGNVQAAGVGITLTAASNVAFLEFPWSPGDVSQAEDRAHRIGQTDSVTIWYMVAQDTIDQKIVTMLEEKREVTDIIHDGRSDSKNSFLAEVAKTVLSD